MSVKSLEIFADSHESNWGMVMATLSHATVVVASYEGGGINNDDVADVAVEASKEGDDDWDDDFLLLLLLLLLVVEDLHFNVAVANFWSLLEMSYFSQELIKFEAWWCTAAKVG